MAGDHYDNALPCRHPLLSRCHITNPLTHSIYTTHSLHYATHTRTELAEAEAEVGADLAELESDLARAAAPAAETAEAGASGAAPATSSSASSDIEVINREDATDGKGTAVHVAVMAGGGGGLMRWVSTRSPLPLPHSYPTCFPSSSCPGPVPNRLGEGAADGA